MELLFMVLLISNLILCACNDLFLDTFLVNLASRMYNLTTTMYNLMSRMPKLTNSLGVHDSVNSLRANH